MTKKELVASASEICGKKIGVEVVDAVLGAITKSLISGEDVTLKGFGSFVIKIAKAKTAQDMNNGKTIIIPEHKVVKFKPSIELKDGVSKS